MPGWLGFSGAAFWRVHQNFWNMWMFMDFQQNQKYISGWWYTQPSEK
jgi:hypothetical protein